jgi:hypothetical protein
VGAPARQPASLIRLWLLRRPLLLLLLVTPAEHAPLLSISNGALLLLQLLLLEWQQHCQPARDYGSLPAAAAMAMAAQKQAQAVVAAAIPRQSVLRSKSLRPGLLARLSSLLHEAAWAMGSAVAAAAASLFRHQSLALHRLQVGLVVEVVVQTAESRHPSWHLHHMPSRKQFLWSSRACRLTAAVLQQQQQQQAQLQLPLEVKVQLTSSPRQQHLQCQEEDLMLLLLLPLLLSSRQSICCH